MGRREREKGKAGEREVRDCYKAAGFEARRGQQRAGAADAPDVIVPGLPWAHTEVKYRQNFSLPGVVKQAREEAEEKLAVVWHRRAARPGEAKPRWLVTMDYSDFLALCDFVVCARQAVDFQPERRDEPDDAK